MNPNREELLFQLALSKPAAKRAAWLDAECDGDAALRQRLEALLAAHEQPETLLATQADTARPTIKLDLADEPPDEAVGQTLGRYKLLERVGEGGCGVVYVAEQTEPVRRRVALKVIKLGMDTKQVVARFEAERQALAMMDHPNIAKVLDAGTTETGRPYFVMELVRGIRITDYCDQAQLSTKDRLDLFIKVCQAIQHAHQKGIIHRDIKPSNILVTLHDGMPVPKVIDFGIAKATEGRLTDSTVYTQLHQFIGTPAYMSPEQAEMSGLDIDTRSDIYSLGVLLYELLAGSTPFDAKELMASGIDAMRKTIREKEPQRPSTRLATLGVDQLTTTAKRRSADTSKLLHQLKGDLDWIVMKCLEKDRTRRYETANGLAADITRHLTNEPVLARPPSAAYKFQKAFRRNKLVFVAGTAVAIALVAGLCLAALGWRQTSAERDKALQARKEAQTSEQKAVEAGQRAHTGEQEARRSAALARRTAYVADMGLVHQAADQGNFARARSLLARYRPKAGEEDIRGFEWRYLWTQTRSDEAARLGEYGGDDRALGRFRGLALSPDGIYLASTTLRGIEIRSFKNRALILTLTNVAKGSIQFSPDSQRLLTSGDSGLELWNTRTWQKETELRGATEPFAFARNGKVIVARRDDHLALWNLQDSRKVADLPGTNLFGNFPAPMAVSSDGNRVFLATLGRIRAWDLQTQTELNAILLPGRGKAPTYSLAHSPDGLIASTHLNGEVRLWDSQTGELLETFEDHRTVVFCAVFSPDGSYLATAGGDQTIALYETRSRKLLRRFKGHEGEIEALMFSGDSRWLVSGCRRDQSVRLWEVTGEAQAETPGLRGPWLQFIDSNRSLVGRSPEGYLRIDVKTGASRPLAIGSASEANSSEAPALLSSVSPDGSRAAVVSADRRSLWVWNIGGGAVEAVLLTNSAILIRGAEFSGDGKRIAVGVEGWKTRVWNTADWTSKSLDDSVSTNALGVWTSLNGSRLVQGDTNGLEVLDFASGKPVVRVPVRGAFYGLALSPDGTLLALGISGGPIQIWNVDQGQQIGSLLGHLTMVRSLSFSPDGKTLASGAGGELKLWDIEVQQEILTWDGLGGVPTTVLFASDGSCLAARIQGGRQLQLWRAPSFEEIAATEAREKAEGKQP